MMALPVIHHRRAILIIWFSTLLLAACAWCFVDSRLAWNFLFSGAGVTIGFLVDGKGKNSQGITEVEESPKP